MSNIKPSSHGIVVDHKESGVRYAVSDRNYNSAIHSKVRDLKPGETVRSFQPKPHTSLVEQPTLDGLDDTEGSSSEGTKTK